MANILVIDDDPDVRDLVKATLESAGHEVFVAVNGRAGMQQYRAKPADLVITDLFMPDQEGLETIKLLRLEFPDVRIIAISGKPAGETMLSVAKRIGATEVMSKPFLPDELLKVVERAL
jgi:DNA-binding response OmpR family regulator